MTSTAKNSTAAICVLVVVALFGAALALQGWKGRTQGFDSLLDIDGAHEILLHQRIPNRSSLNSFAVHNPPGAAWLTLPGVILFSDPRLFGYVGSIALYVGTLIGIFLLARTFFGSRCAILAVVLYGISELGLYVADSLWPRYPLHFFYVWMVYWTVQWVRQGKGKYLAAALVTLAMGMNVFLEIAPALFIFPVVWWFYRPPLRVRPILVGGILAVAIWYPYLKFESGRNFADLRSSVGRHSNLPENFKESWCDPALTLVNLEGSSEPVYVEPAPLPTAADSISTRVLRRLLPLWERAHLAVGGLSFNLESAAPIPGISIVLALVLLAGLVILSISGTSARTLETIDRRWRYWLPKFAVGMIVMGLLWNEFLIARYLSPHGFLQPSTISTVRWLQAILVLGGAILLMFRNRIAAFVQRTVNRLSVPVEAEIETAQVPVSARLLVLSLVVPWVLLLALVEDADRLGRMWWLWPVQVVFLAALATYLPARLGMPRMLAWTASVLLIVVLGANAFLLSRVQAWTRGGWAGTDPAEVQVVNFVASRLQGRSRAAIGYQLFIWNFMAIFNVVDPRYKVGADFDLNFKDLGGVANTNQCAEGVSPNDEFRIVQTKPSWTNLKGKGYFDVPSDPSFHLLQQFGSYQVFKREPAQTSTVAQ